MSGRTSTLTETQIIGRGLHWINENEAAWHDLIAWSQRDWKRQLSRPVQRPLRINLYAEMLRGQGIRVPNSICAYLARRLESATGATFTKAHSKVDFVLQGGREAHNKK